MTENAFVGSESSNALFMWINFFVCSKLMTVGCIFLENSVYVGILFVQFQLVSGLPRKKPLSLDLSILAPSLDFLKGRLDFCPEFAVTMEWLRSLVGVKVEISYQEQSYC